MDMSKVLTPAGQRALAAFNERCAAEDREREAFMTGRILTMEKFESLSIADKIKWCGEKGARIIENEEAEDIRIKTAFTAEDRERELKTLMQRFGATEDAADAK